MNYLCSSDIFFYLQVILLTSNNFYIFQFSGLQLMENTLTILSFISAVNLKMMGQSQSIAYTKSGYPSQFYYYLMRAIDYSNLTIFFQYSIIWSSNNPKSLVSTLDYCSRPFNSPSFLKSVTYTPSEILISGCIMLFKIISKLHHNFINLLLQLLMSTKVRTNKQQPQNKSPNKQSNQNANNQVINKDQDQGSKKQLSRLEKQNLKNLKKNLEGNLELVDSRVGELTESQRQKSKAMGDEQRKRFISQMVKARKQLQKQREQKIIEREESYKKMCEREIQQIRIKEQQQKKKKQQQILKRSQSLELRKKIRKNELEEQNKILKEKMHEKILSQRMLDRYKESQSKNLEEHKKMLAERRAFHRPLTKTEFQEHLQKINQLKSSRQKQKMPSQHTTNTTKLYKSNWYKEAKASPKQYVDEKHQEEVEHIKQMKDKLNKYAEYVRANFKPQISRKKSKTMSQKNRSVPMPKTKDLRQLGLQYLQYSKKNIELRKEKQNEEQQKAEKRVKPINYLEELRRNHPQKKSPHQYVESIKEKTNLSEGQKAQKILDYIESLERKAKMREQKGKAMNDVADLELDQLYMEAIAIKLSLLEKQ